MQLLIKKTCTNKRNAITFRIHDRCLWSMILKFSQKSFWDSWILVYCQFKNYFTFITKKKLYFSLTCSFYCCLVKKGSALKVSQQFAIRGLVAYKKSVYQLNYILSHNPDGKTQLQRCLVPTVKTKFIAVLGFAACFV